MLDVGKHAREMSFQANSSLKAISHNSVFSYQIAVGCSDYTHTRQHRPPRTASCPGFQSPSSETRCGEWHVWYGGRTGERSSPLTAKIKFTFLTRPWTARTGARIWRWVTRKNKCFRPQPFKNDDGRPVPDAQWSKHEACIAETQHPGEGRV